MKINGIQGTALTVFLTASALPAAADELSYSHGFAPNSAVGKASENFAAAVEEKSGGELTVKIYPMTLMNLLETGPGVRDGLADMGYVLAPYYAAEYPHYSLLHELTMSVNLRDMTGTESLAYAGAITEYTFHECADCRADFAEQNQVYLSGATSSIYSLLCNKPVVTEEDMRNKKIRAGSPSFSRFAEHFGATGIQMAANEVFEGLSQGVLDCAMLSAPELTTYSLKDVVTDVTLGVPGGIYAGAAVGNINRDSWQGLTDEERGWLLWGANVLSADISWNYYEQEAQNLEMAREMGINVHDASPEFREKIREYVRGDLEGVAEIFQTQYGVEDASAMIEDFMPFLERWYGLVEGVDSREALRELFWTEIYAKVDPATYGQ
ncbi:MAG: C4-dicarboxylate TRAP transporter substrate-binding protein [Pseudooceanicola nanhaiensis]|uniref:C4-dicarboxylate TRAP transporter substrate-binding protein n=1 Tax=Rhodobacterales TaxID=204455 RepID=UPI00405A1DE8